MMVMETIGEDDEIGLLLNLLRREVVVHFSHVLKKSRGRCSILLLPDAR